jgi:hypothetical protein
MVAKKKTEDAVVEIVEFKESRIVFHLLGTTPLLMNRFAEKAKQQLLMGGRKKNTAELAVNLKHDPVAEYRAACYRNRDADRPALFHAPSTWFHQAIAAAAIDVPGVAKAKIERLVNVTSPQIDLFGTQKLRFDMVRSADMGKTPDVRSRPCFEEWACKVEMSFAPSFIKVKDLTTLMAWAGQIIGVGDWRRQKGGPFGSFKIISETDPNFRRIVKEQGRKAQQAAWDNPETTDPDSEELLSWYFETIEGRENVSAAVPERFMDRAAAE